MKDNSLKFILISLIGISLTGCRSQTAVSEESARIDSIVNQFKNHSYNKPDSVLTVASQLLDQPKESKNKAKLLLLLASTHGLLGAYDSAIALSEKALDLAGNDARLLAGIHNELGVSYDYKSDYRNALEHYHQAQDYFQEADDTSGFIKVRNNIGLIYQNTGELQRAKEIFEDCLRLSREKLYVDEEIMALSNLGAVENELHNYKKCTAIFQRSIVG